MVASTKTMAATAAASAVSVIAPTSGRMPGRPGLPGAGEVRRPSRAIHSRNGATITAVALNATANPTATPAQA